VGAEELFGELAEENAALLGAKDVSRVLTASPHCMNVINKDYATQGLGAHAEHYTQVLERALDAGTLKPTAPVSQKVAYHDPCYLGRWSGIYDPPRRLLDAIPGLTRVELRRHHEQSLCCGGGGGGLWGDVPTEERFAVLRVREALEVGVQVIATACPYCTSMLEDAVKVLDLEDEIAIRDVAELLAESVE
jgi:Fe-S oxidoreductase